MTQPVSGTDKSPTGYDAVWAAAIALNKTINHLTESGSMKDLGDFAYDDKAMTDLMKEKLREVSFRSISDRVGFSKTQDGVRLIAIQMVKGSKLSTVGSYDETKRRDHKLLIDDIWNGHVPRDGKLMKTTVISLPTYIYVPITSLAGLGIIFAVTFLCFNIINRNVKIIRLSSPDINNIILIGCILAYLSVFIQDIHNTKNSIYCIVNNFLLLLAFSLSFGALFAKTWRTYRIFRATLQMEKLKSRSIHDSRLCLMVCGFVGLNSLVLFIWILIDPQTVVTEAIPNKKELRDDMVIQYASNSCWSRQQDTFLISIIAIEGLFLLLGVFLAWETRKVELSMLNESRYIGMCIYNVVVLGVVGVLVSYSLRNDPILVYIITSSIICLCATVTQCLLFVPKVVACRQFKPGKLQDSVFNNVSNQFDSLRVRKASIGSQTEPINTDVPM